MKISNVEELIRKLSKVDAQKRLFKGNPTMNDSIISHVQGFVACPIIDSTYYGIATHNDIGDSEGFFIFCKDGKDTRRINIDLKGFNHPSGFQKQDNYLVVCVENSIHDEYHILAYKSNPTAMTLKRLPLDIYNSNSGAKAIGFTKYNDRCLIVSYEGKTLSVYLQKESTSFNLETMTAKDFEKFIIDEDDNPIEDDVQDISLVTQYDGQVYLIAYRNNKKKTLTSYNDYVDLYKFNVYSNKCSISKRIVSSQIKTKNGSIKGFFGVHVRWGAGLNIIDESTIEVSVSQRNFTNTGLTYNIFKSSI